MQMKYWAMPCSQAPTNLLWIILERFVHRLRQKTVAMNQHRNLPVQNPFVCFEWDQASVKNKFSLTIAPDFWFIVFVLVEWGTFWSLAMFPNCWNGDIFTSTMDQLYMRKHWTPWSHTNCTGLQWTVVDELKPNIYVAGAKLFTRFSKCNSWASALSNMKLWTSGCF